MANNWNAGAGWNANYGAAGSNAGQGYNYSQPGQRYGQSAQPYGGGFGAPGAGDAYGGPQAGFNSHDASYNPQMTKEQEEAAAIAKWASAYEHRETPKEVVPKSGPAARKEANEESKRAAQDGDLTVVREGGGKKWQDKRLTEWDESHFRLFVGNLAGEVTDDLLFKEFSKYGTVEKTRVIRDPRTTKSKGFGFVSFSNGDEYLRAAREMHGKYIGSHPVTISRAKTNVKAVHVEDANKKLSRDKHKDKAGGHAHTGAGVQKNKKKDKKSLASKYGLTPIG